MDAQSLTVQTALECNGFRAAHDAALSVKVKDCFKGL